MDSQGATAALVAVAAAGMWEGLALFDLVGGIVAQAEDPEVPPKDLLRQFRRHFPNAKAFQMPLLFLGGTASGVTAWGLRDSHVNASTAFGVAAAANLAVMAYTMKGIMPLNNRLMAPGEVEGRETDEGIRGLLQQWGKLHGVRVAVGTVALGATLYGTHALLTRK